LSVIAEPPDHQMLCAQDDEEEENKDKKDKIEVVRICPRDHGMRIRFAKTICLVKIIFFQRKKNLFPWQGLFVLFVCGRLIK
jgi:hypothetical protein